MLGRKCIGCAQICDFCISWDSGNNPVRNACKLLPNVGTDIVWMFTLILIYI